MSPTSNMPESLRELETQRAEFVAAAAHDLRGTWRGRDGHGRPHVRQSRTDMREKFMGSLERNVRALHRLLEDVPAWPACRREEFATLAQ